MKKLGVIILLVAVALSVFILASQRVRGEAIQSGEQWEYGLFSYSVAGGSWTTGSEIINGEAPAGVDPKGAAKAKAMDLYRKLGGTVSEAPLTEMSFMDALGSQRWEIIHVEMDHELAKVTVWFKRHVQAK